jgi:hypothetical protein
MRWSGSQALALVRAFSGTLAATLGSTLHGALVSGYDTTLVSDAHTTGDPTESPGRMAGTLKAKDGWLYRTHSGNPRQMRSRRPLSADNRTPPPSGLRLHPV